MTTAAATRTNQTISQKEKLLLALLLLLTVLAFHQLFFEAMTRRVTARMRATTLFTPNGLAM